MVYGRPFQGPRPLPFTYVLLFAVTLYAPLLFESLSVSNLPKASTGKVGQKSYTFRDEVLFWWRPPPRQSGNFNCRRREE